MADYNRPVSRSGVEERPRTRWRRDERPMTRGYAEDRPSITDLSQILQRQTPDDRPTSRRGLKEERSSGVEIPASMTGRVTRPGSSSRQGMPSRLAGKMTIQDRPLTQQGIMRPPSAAAIRGTGLKPVATGTGAVSQRQVQDRSYFMGLVRTAMNDLNVEITKLREQSEEMRTEKAAAQVYEKRVRELAEELTGLQEKLSDYNSLIDRLNTGAEVSDVNLEINEANAECDDLTKEVEGMFAQKQLLEEQANKLKEQLKQEQRISETLVAQLPQEDQSRYADLQRETQQLDQQAERLQKQLDQVGALKASLEEQITDSEPHQELLRLWRRLQELTKRRDTLAEEEKARESPAQQRDSLLAAVKSHNTELAALEAQADREKQNIASLQNSIAQAQQALDQNNSERNTQFSELKKREAAMEEFLAGFDSSMEEEKNRRATLEAEVVEVLEKCSALLVQSQQLPSVEHFTELREQLGLKEGEVERARFTTQGLSQQETQLQLQMQRVTELEQKVSTEMSTIRSKMVSMKGEMSRLTDLGALRVKEEGRRRDVERQRELAEKKRVQVLSELREVEEEYNSLQAQLAENDLWTQLNHLEHKWSQAAQNNHALAEHIANRQAQANYQPIRQRVVLQVSNHNNALKGSLRTQHT